MIRINGGIPAGQHRDPPKGTYIGPQCGEKGCRGRRMGGKKQARVLKRGEDYEKRHSLLIFHEFEGGVKGGRRELGRRRVKKTPLTGVGKEPTRKPTGR